MSKVNVKFRYNENQAVEVKQTQPGPIALNNLYDSYTRPHYAPINMQQQPSIRCSSLEKSTPKKLVDTGSQTLLLKSKSSLDLNEQGYPNLQERAVIQQVTYADMIHYPVQKKKEEPFRPDTFNEFINKKDIPKREQSNRQQPKKEQPKKQMEALVPVGTKTSDNKPADPSQTNPKKSEPQIQINPLIMPIGSQKSQPEKKMTKQQVRAAYQYVGFRQNQAETPKGGCCSWCGNCDCKKTQKAYPIRQ